MINPILPIWPGTRYHLVVSRGREEVERGRERDGERGRDYRSESKIKEDEKWNNKWAKNKKT